MDPEPTGEQEPVESPALAETPAQEEDFASVYRTHYEAVWRALCCLGVPESSADDAVQDVFLVVHRRLSEFDPRRPMRSWLFGIARRVALRHHSTRARAQRHLRLVEGAEPRRPDDELARSQALEIVEAFLDQLDDDQRAVFVLADIEGMTVPEIAEIVGANVSTVYSRLRLARKRFDRALARHRAREQRRSRDVP